MRTFAEERWEECSECNASACIRSLVKDVGQVRLAIMQWEEKWKVMMSELGEGAKIPDLWRMSALLEICPKDVKEQMLLRLDEVGENYENLPQGEGDIVHVEQGRTVAGSEGNSCADGARLRQWK